MHQLCPPLDMHMQYARACRPGISPRQIFGRKKQSKVEEKWSSSSHYNFLQEDCIDQIDLDISRLGTREQGGLRWMGPDISLFGPPVPCSVVLVNDK